MFFEHCFLHFSAFLHIMQIGRLKSMAKTNNGCIISLPSETYAMSSQRLLSKNGIASRIVKTDPSATKKGCTVGIEVDCRFTAKAKGILINHSIPVS